MKKILIVIGFILTFAMNACESNMEELVSQEDIQALTAMETSYGLALAYNDSLASYIESTGITNDNNCNYHDNMFHHYDSVFVANHNRYSHKNTRDEHGANQWNMGSGCNCSNMMGSGNGSMMGSGNGNGMMAYMNNLNFCSNNNLSLMDSLMVMHTEYHP